MNSPILGVDIGRSRTGLALSLNGIFAHPLGVVTAKLPHLQAVLQEIVQVIKREEIATIVIGLPLTSNQAPTSQSLRTEQIVEQLRAVISQEKLTPEIILVNEFHSSLDAAQLYPDVEIDAAAATILLQDYIDSHAA